MYALLLLSVHFLNEEIEKTLYSFDLDGDGGFSENEITPGQQKAMDDFVGDTGRAMAPITGAVFSLVYVAFVFLLWGVSAWIGARVRVNRI